MFRKNTVLRSLTMSAASFLQMLAMSGKPCPVAVLSAEEESLRADLSALQGWEVDAWKAQLPMSTFLLFRPTRFRKGLTPLHMMSDLPTRVTRHLQNRLFARYVVKGESMRSSIGNGSV